MADERNNQPPSLATEEESLTQNETEKVKRTFGETVVFVIKNVTVEPTLGVFMLVYLIMSLTTQNLSLEKACRVNLNFSQDICDSLKLQELGSQNVYELQTQQLLSRFLSYRTYITATIPSLLALLVGSFSDKTGHRKIFLIIPIVGQILACINNIINVYFFHQLSLEVLIFSEAIIEGLSGGLCLVIVSSFAFISTITTNEERTFRMGLLNFAFTLGFPVGMGLSGILIKSLGYYVCYGITASVQFINLLYTSFLLRDPEKTIDQKWHEKRGGLHLCRVFFDFANIRQTVRVVFKNGPNNRRMRMCLMMLVVSILFGPMYGEISILYMNTRYRFNWDEIKFSIFQSYSSVTHTIGTIFSITVFSKYLQWHDSILGIISTLSKIASSFVYCFAPTGQIFYIAPLVDILNGTSLLALRSIVSKLVAPDELGKVNSIFGLTENLMPLLYVPLYTGVYNATMETLPGAVFLMGAIMTVPAVAVFIWIFYDYKKQLRMPQKKKGFELQELNRGSRNNNDEINN